MTTPASRPKRALGLISALLGIGLLLGAGLPNTAPDADLDLDGHITAVDLQCQVLLFSAQSGAYGTCQNGCAPGSTCRPGFAAPACLPNCLSPDVSLPATAIDCGAAPQTCLQQVPKHTADLNCDGKISNVDLQFLVWTLLDAPSGLGTPDADSDHLLNGCDPDSDGDGVPDTLDPAPLDPTICGDNNLDGCDDCDPNCAAAFDPDCIAIKVQIDLLML